MRIEYFLVAILIVQLSIIYSLYRKGKNYVGITKCNLLELTDYLSKLFNSNINGELLIFIHANERVILKKRQDESTWWIEIKAKELIIQRVKFFLQYVDSYQVFISSEYYTKNKSKENNSIFLGHDRKIIAPILEELIIKLYELDEDGKFYIFYKNMRPANPDFVGEEVY